MLHVKASSVEKLGLNSCREYMGRSSLSLMKFHFGSSINLE